MEEKFAFLNTEEANAIAGSYGTPVYVYSEERLRKAAAEALAFPNAYGLTVRYAYKASPNGALLNLFQSLGLHFDASSGWEVHRALKAGIEPGRISLSTQELPADFTELLDKGIAANACSLDQLERIGKAFPGREVGVRFNPGSGSGHNNRTNTGGRSSSFGIWHEWVSQVREIARKHRLRVVRLHTHVGSGGNPEVWQKVAQISLSLAPHFPEVDTLNLGGGYKVARMPDERTTNLQSVGAPVKDAFENFAGETGRKLKLEIEPGTYLVARAGCLLCRIQDIVTTGEEGYDFIKTDSGMTEILRPSMYGARHAITLHPQDERSSHKPYIVVGHCCESGDLLTTAQGDPELLEPRTLPEAATGDLLAIECAGAYCAAMPAKNYNSFPEAPEVLLRGNGEATLIRKRQELEQIVANEIPLSF